MPTYGRSNYRRYARGSSSSTGRGRRRPQPTTSSSSTPAFETPQHRQARPSKRSSRALFARASSSVPRGSLPPDTSPPALPTLQRISLRGRGSQFSRPHVADDRERDDLEDEEEVQRREEDDSLNEIIMAIDMRDRGTLGCAYYIAREEKLCLTQDIKLAGLDIVDTLKLHAQPTTLLINTRADEALEDHLAREARSANRSDEDGNNNMFGSYVLLARQSSEFSYETAKNKLIDLDIFGKNEPELQFSRAGELMAGDGEDEEFENGSRSGRLMRLAGWIDLESRLTIGCAGAVLSDIQRRRNANFLPGDEAGLAAFRISTLEMISLADMMFINADTLLSLQIFNSESHPNSHMQGPTKSSGAKESLSVFGLFKNLAHTPQGKQKLRQIFLRPTLNMAILEQRQTGISILSQSGNTSCVDLLVKSLKRIKNIRTVVIHLKKGTSFQAAKGRAIQRGVWGSLQEFTYQVLKLFEALCELQNGQLIPVVAKLLSYMNPAQGKIAKLRMVGQLITDTVDFQRSAEQHRTAVMQGVDSELDKMKQIYDGMEDLLTKVARVVASEVPEWATQYVENCIFFPQLGFLTVVPLDPATGKGRFEGEGMENDVWERRFNTDQLGYYKNDRMKELDSYFGDMYGMICDREIEIVHDLAIKILELEDLLVESSELCGELDSIIALAIGSVRYKLGPARIVSDNIIHIEAGRHLLQETVVPSYVTNDTFLVGGPGTEDDSELLMSTPHSQSCRFRDVQGPSLLMMTGPNYSGKSIYLKQIALIVYLAHIGSFVPADSATIGLTDKILTRIATRESVSKNQSAFMIDLQQVVLAMALATRRSLVLIDEFGKGTSAVDGAGLACGVFEHFLSLGVERPKVLGATHFHEIFESGFLAERPELAFGHMEVRVDRTRLAEEEITYLYNFIPTRSMASFGTECAAMNGIDSSIVKKAQQLILLQARGEDLVAACAIMSEEETKDLELAEQVARALLSFNLDGTRPSDVRGIIAGILAVEDMQSNISV